MDTNQTSRTNHHPAQGIRVARRRGPVHPIFLFALLLLTACGRGGGAQPTPTPFPTPVVPEKPTYTVQRGAVVKTLEFRGRVSPVTEQELFFKTDGYVRAVHVAQGDLVETGDLLAELEIGDLENQLAQVQVALQTAELQLSQAEQENADALAEAEINLHRAEVRLRQAEQENADVLAEARIALEKATLAQELEGPTEADIAQGAVDSAQAQLEQLLAGPDEQSVEIARLNWELARNTLWQLQLERDAIKGRDGVPRYQKAQADAAVSAAEISALIAQLQYELAGKGATDEAIGVAQAALRQALTQARAAESSHRYTLRLQAKEVELAELRVDKLERGVDPLLAQEAELAGLRVATLERGVNPLLAQDVERARIDLQRIQGQIEDARLVAPFDGRILSLNIRQASLAIAYKSALILGDPGALEITADLGADKLTQMSVDQAATIRLLNRPEQDWSGHVRQLPYPYGGGAGQQTDGDKATRIALDDPDVTLEIGELATVTILLEQKDDVLWLPPAAIRSFQGRNFVVIQEGDQQQRADVRLGLESEERIEILEGVEESQVVVGP